MKDIINLQLFAEEGATGASASAAVPATDTAENNENEKRAAAEQKQGTKSASAEETKAKYTDADVDEILNKKFAKWQAQQERAVDEAKKLAAMDAKQKLEYQRDKLQKELDDLKKQAAISAMMQTSRKVLSDNGINVSDELLSVMVTTDAEETKAAIDGFTTAFKDAVEAAVKERLKGEPPRKGTGGGVATMTKDQIMAIRDPKLRQEKILENKELFNF